MAELRRGVRPEAQQVVSDRQPQDQAMEVRARRARWLPLCPRGHGLTAGRVVGVAP